MRFRAYMMVVVLTVLGCQQSEAERQPAPSIQVVSGVDLAAGTHKLIFDGGATEVDISLRNHRDVPVGISGLRDEAELILADGERLKIHEISVGVAKPVIVPAKQTVNTSLLFSGNGEKAVRLRVLQSDVPLQR